MLIELWTNIMKTKIIIILLLFLTISFSKDLDNNTYIYIKYVYVDGTPSSYVLTKENNESSFYNKFKMLIPTEFFFKESDYNCIEKHILEYDYNKDYGNIGISHLSPLVFIEVVKNGTLLKSEILDHNLKVNTFFIDFKEMLIINRINNEDMNRRFERYCNQ